MTPKGPAVLIDGRRVVTYVACFRDTGTRFTSRWGTAMTSLRSVSVRGFPLRGASGSRTTIPTGCAR